MTKAALGEYDALLFDMDGTILTSVAATNRAWTAWSKRAGAPSDAVLAFLHGRRAIDTIRKFASPGMNLEEEVRWLDNLELEDLEGIAAVPGASALLNSLRRDQWAVVTSANGELARRRIKYAGLPHPDCLISSDDVERGKPDPEGFLKAAAVLGVQPDRCLVFEDTQAGARAGLAAGASVVLVAGTHDQLDLPVVATIQNFADLLFQHFDGAIRVTSKTRAAILA